MTAGTGHAALMDAVYRRQRLIYDTTRKYFLFGRDTVIEGLDIRRGAAVLEVACGTGRNLARIGARWPGARLYGFDISEQMLISARAKLGPRAALAQGDACRYDPQALFGVPGFDRIVISYALSMIPDWEGALRESARRLAPGGSLHIVDFGTQDRLPGWFRRSLRAWLAKFHVTPRDTLPEVLARVAQDTGTQAETRSLMRGYATLAVLHRPA